MIVRAAGLGVWIDGRQVLREIDLSIREGECVALVGANGAGKTTLLRALATLLPIETGTLELFGIPAARSRGDIRARLGMIGHRPMLYNALTVLENLEFFARLYGVEDPLARARQLADSVGIGAHADQRAGSLSRGLAQRTSIARALVHDPELLLADEPWTGLDRAAAEVFDRTLRDFRGSGRTTIVASHDAGRAVTLADRVVVLREGRLVLDAPSAECDAGAIWDAAGTGTAAIMENRP